MKPRGNLFFDGKALCSQRDPVKEAVTWCKDIVTGVGPIWILGVGAGFHIEELLKQNPNRKIFAIDHRKELIEIFLENTSLKTPQLRLLNVTTPADILRTDEFKRCGPHLFPSFIFYPAVQGVEEFYSQIQKTLLGKTPESFEMLTQMLKFTSSPSTARLRSLNTFNIKEIESLYDGVSGSPEKKIISILRELVR